MPPNKARLSLRWDVKTAARFRYPNSQRYEAIANLCYFRLTIIRKLEIQ
jgi:hypothetical protein